MYILTSINSPQAIANDLENKESYSYVTSLIHIYDMTHPYIWHDSSIHMTWLIPTCRPHTIHPYVPYLTSRKGAPPIGNDSGKTVVISAHMTWLIQIIQMCRDSSIRAMPHSYVPWLMYTCHDSFIRAMPHSYVPSRIHMWHMARLTCIKGAPSIGNDSGNKVSHTYVPWLIHKWHDSSICAMTHLYKRRAFNWQRLRKDSGNISISWVKDLQPLFHFVLIVIGACRQPLLHSHMCRVWEYPYMCRAWEYACNTILEYGVALVSRID